MSAAVAAPQEGPQFLRREPDSKCIICSCTDSFACEGGCSWLAINRDHRKGVCSACVSGEYFGAVGPTKRQLMRERIATRLLDRYVEARS